MAYYLGIDVGTNETKGVLIDRKCQVVAYCGEGHTVQNPKPGWFEHDAQDDWWGSFCRIAKRLIADSGVKPEEIGCVGLSALGCDCLPVDEDCNPLCNAILYGVDSRSHAEIDWLNEHYGEDAEKVFGHPICSSDIAPKVLWLKNNRPEIHAKAHKFLTASSFLCAKLTGEYTIDKYLAEDFLPLYQLSDNSINEEGCRLFCRPDQMARVCHATEIAGKVTPKAALETGLSAGTPVLVGTGDSGAEAVSTGVFCPGDLMIQLGSSAFFVFLCDHLAEENRMWPGTFIIPEVYSVCAGTNTAGTLTKWLRDEFYPDLKAAETAGGENAYAAMAAQAEGIPAGANGLICLPYFAGERTPINDPFAQGMFFGLNSTHTRGHIYKAALEGIGYSIAQHVDILEKDGLPIRKIMVAGGGTKNRLWLQIVSDILGKPLQVAKISFGASYGDAIMAALAAGEYASWEELSQVIEPAFVVTPNMENHKIYTVMQDIFSKLYEGNKELMHRIAELRGE